MPQQLTITVTDEQAKRIERLVADGSYASADNVAQAALDTADFATIDLPDEVLRALVADALADPRPDVAISEGFREVYAHIEALTPRSR